MAFRNSKTGRHSEIKQTRPSTKQDFSGEALSKQNTGASLASLSCNSFRAPTEWSAIFAFGVWYRLRMMLKILYYQVDLFLFSFVEIKVSLTGLSKFKEGVSKIKTAVFAKRHQSPFARD